VESRPWPKWNTFQCGSLTFCTPKTNPLRALDLVCPCCRNGSFPTTSTAFARAPSGTRAAFPMPLPPCPPSAAPPHSLPPLCRIRMCQTAFFRKTNAECSIVRTLQRSPNGSMGPPGCLSYCLRTAPPRPIYVFAPTPLR
jgi:hypothetical protein